MNKPLDLIILGAGPAGLSASIYASRYKMDHLVIGQTPGGLITEAHKVCNFPTESEISGEDLGAKIKDHAEKAGGQIVFKTIKSVVKVDGGFEVLVDGAEKYTAKSLIIATGTIHRHLGLAKEKEFIGHGVSYCSTCDGPFFRNKVVAVVGGGNSAMTAALHLSSIAEKVYLIVRGDKLKGEVVWQDQVIADTKIEKVFNTNVVDFIGASNLEKIKLSAPYQDQEELSINGLFIEIGSVPELSVISDLNVSLDDYGYIQVEKDMATSVPGVYAAGDVTNGSNNFRQVITACAEGAIATNSAFLYIKTGV